MDFENTANKAEVPSRVELNDAISQYPESVLLLQVEDLSKDTYSALYNEYNQGKFGFTFIDFALCEDIETVSELLNKLETTDDESERRVVAGQIAKELVK